VQDRDKAGHGYTLIAVAEGAKPKGGPFATQTGEKDAFGNVRLGGIADQLAKQIEQITKKESRSVILGHLQRGGAPTAFDRVYGTRLGIYAAELADKKKFGQMLALKGVNIESVPISEALKGYRVVPKEAIRVMNVLRGI
jgi:ATP-dependent phosphofructokinase / diphosphate-dependent phosphofructokinase